MELLVLIAILGVMVVMSIPELSRWGARMRIDGAVRQTALHIAAARMKAAANGFDHTVTVVPPNTNYTNDGGTAKTLSATRVGLVIEGSEGAGQDDNGNMILNEWSNPLPNGASGAPDAKLVTLLADGVFATTAPPATVGNFTAVYPPPPLVFRRNGMADINLSQTVLFALYLTDITGIEYYAVTVWHSGRVRTYKWNRNSGNWSEGGDE